MTPYLIRTPIWDNRKVGIAEFRMKGRTFFDIKIGYKGREGELLYPDIYRIRVKDTLKYPTQVVKGVKLRIIPIEDFEVVDG